MFMTEGLILIGLFLLLVAIRVPISFGLGITAIVTSLYMGMSPIMLVQRIGSGLQSFPLVTIPLFILAGLIMTKGGISRRIVNFAYILVGPLPGGLAMVNVVQAMFFGGITGSSTADVSSIGPMVIPMMEEKGYDRGFACALTACASVQGVIIPPSHNIILFAMVVGGISIANLFLAGYIPGIALGVALMISSLIISIKRGYPREKIPPIKKCLPIIWQGLISVLTAIIVVGGIIFGVFTATEASAVAVVYALFLSLFVFREMKVRDIWPIVLQSVRTTAVIMLLVATATAFGYMMTVLMIPLKVTAFFLSVTHNPIILLLMINALLLFLGCIMDMAPLILITTPVLLPAVVSIGMSPITFGILLMVNLGIGLTTPPVGSALFVACSVGKAKMENVAKAMLLFWPAMIIVLLLTTYFPWFTTFLPNLFK
jgi:tripartite ATP-independent transporter DctM subunit